jgi:hypothetical protein
LLRELANPNLHDIPTQLPFRIELWDRNDQRIRWVIAASSSVTIAHAALDAAIADYLDQRFTLRNGILVIRDHAPNNEGDAGIPPDRGRIPALRANRHHCLLFSFQRLSRVAPERSRTVLGFACYAQNPGKTSKSIWSGLAEIRSRSQPLFRCV